MALSRNLIIQLSLLLAPLILPLAAACSNPSGEAPPTSTVDRGTEDNIREAVFRYQFEHNASAQQQSAPVYYLGLGTFAGQLVDPSAELMARSEGNAPSVKKHSELKVDPQRGAPGILFITGEIRRMTADEVEVNGGYAEGGFSASVNVYTVARTSGEWVVTKKQAGVDPVEPFEPL